MSDVDNRSATSRKNSASKWDTVSRDTHKAQNEQARAALQPPPLNTGPNTTGQLVALNHLEQIADFQQTSHQALEADVTRPQVVLGSLEDASTLRRAREGRRHGLLARMPWPLFPVLAVQVVLVSRLLRANTAFSDEALYLWAGHLEWAHWLNGAKIPSFPAFFSGSPVVYPPLGAIADSIGGLVGARLLSMAFMLGVTCLLWSTASRLFGRPAAFFATALFALLGPTLKLSAFATYDAMSLFFMAMAAWCAVHAGPRKDVGRWMVIGTCALVLSNAAAYSSAILDPLIIGLVLLTGWPQSSAKQAASRAAALTAYVVAVLIMLFSLGGGLYAVGIDQTVLTRTMGVDSPSKVLSQAAGWIGIIVVLAVIGLVLGLRFESGRARKTLLALLTCAALLVPLEQARIHTTTSLDKHADMGAWFAAIAAGYAISRLTGFRRPAALRVLTIGIAVVALVIPARIGMSQARSLFDAWPNSTRFVAAMRPLAVGTAGNMLVETPSIPEYYLPQAGSQWERWSTTGSIRLANGRNISTTVGGVGNAKTYIGFIKKRYFTVIALQPSKTTEAFDGQLTDYLKQDPDYEVAATVKDGGGLYTIWALTGGQK